MYRQLCQEILHKIPFLALAIKIGISFAYSSNLEWIGHKILCEEDLLILGNGGKFCNISEIDHFSVRMTVHPVYSEFPVFFSVFTIHATSFNFSSVVFIIFHDAKSIQ